ncbi:MAG: hypothetical protein HY791_23510 [Deltaproteobacteria bacterium]|nr:hypothetical protein [Deltaproteobacteria bacterium]
MRSSVFVVTALLVFSGCAPDSHSTSLELFEGQLGFVAYSHDDAVGLGPVVGPGAHLDLLGAEDTWVFVAELAELRRAFPYVASTQPQDWKARIATGECAEGKIDESTVWIPFPESGRTFELSTEGLVESEIELATELGTRWESRCGPVSTPLTKFGEDVRAISPPQVIDGELRTVDDLAHWFSIRSIVPIEGSPSILALTDRAIYRFVQGEALVDDPRYVVTMDELIIAAQLWSDLHAEFLHAGPTPLLHLVDETRGLGALLELAIESDLGVRSATVGRAFRSIELGPDGRTIYGVDGVGGAVIGAIGGPYERRALSGPAERLVPTGDAEFPFIATIASPNFSSVEIRYGDVFSSDFESATVQAARVRNLVPMRDERGFFILGLSAEGTLEIRPGQGPRSFTPQLSPSESGQCVEETGCGLKVPLRVTGANLLGFVEDHGVSLLAGCASPVVVRAGGCSGSIPFGVPEFEARSTSISGRRVWIGGRAGEVVYADVNF